MGTESQTIPAEADGVGATADMRTATPYDRAVFVDHLIYVSDDLDATAAAVRDLLGLGSVPGGVHPGGTYNIIVPLGPPAYLELLGVADAQGDNGRLLTDHLAAEGEHLVQWAIRVHDIEAVAERLGVMPHSGSVTNADGSTATWRGVAHPDPERLLPFVIEYANFEERHRRREAQFAAARHDVVPGPIARVEVGGDERELRAWLGPNDLPVVFAGGAPGITTAAIATGVGEVNIPRRLRPRS
jgi:Glyoxalase-like domain